MIDKKHHTKLSKFLSMVLRHKPEVIEITLDSNGWTSVSQLLEKMNSYGKQIDFETLEVILETNNKKRFSFNEDKTKIRANQGHSVEIELGYERKYPPSVLYHGTSDKNVVSIYKSGIQKKKRHHVHLSKDIETAKSVGQRHGKPVIFEILTEEMHNEGYEFFESKNGVWLTDEIPVRFIRKME
ncbi:MAG: RNA 2'-phosphotransferase [Bacteroidales bacterium]|nr:RNA 2'-phosphotransferase [Bacteroidales bacterium]